MNIRSIGEFMPTRRDLLKFGGLGLLGASADSVWPLNCAPTATKPNPRGNARNVLFYEFSGAISHVESFDFKENAGTPQGPDVRKLKRHLSAVPLFPRMENVWTSSRSCAPCMSHEEVHFRGQYYQQTGRH